MTGGGKKFGADLVAAVAGWRGLLLVIGLVLAWQALRAAAWGTVWQQLLGLAPLALLGLLAFNILLLPLMTARWWLLLRTLGQPIGLGTLCGYRLAANAVSLLTPGPHCGGEPLLVYLLHQQRIPLPAATTSVTLDRLLELLASILVLCASLIILIAAGSSPFAGAWALPLVLVMLIALTAFLTALFTGRRPISRLVCRCRQWGGNLHPVLAKSGERLLAALVQGEVLAESLWQPPRRPLLLANLWSLGQWLGVLAEFWLMSVVLGTPLSWCPLLAVVITARLAFFTPLPAGLGVLETALPWVTAALGLGSVLGLSLCLLIRGRDIIFTPAGLGLAMKYLTGPAKASTVPVGPGGQAPGG